MSRFRGRSVEVGCATDIDFAKGLVEPLKAREINRTASAWTRGATLIVVWSATFDLSAKSSTGIDVPFRITLKSASRGGEWQITAIAFDLKA